jgi:hypothetical protein
VTGDTVGGLVANLAIGQVGEADIVTVSGSIALSIQRTGVWATAVVLDLGTVADDVLVIATGVGQQVWTALGVIPNGGTDAGELEADGPDL